VFLLRISLPDVPGSLGAAASALGTVGADISAVEIVEKYAGYAVDDFIVDLPPDAPPDSLVSACAQLDGVDVVWLSRYPESWGLQGDVDVLNAMTEDPANAERILMSAAPEAFRANWALLANRVTGETLDATELAPDLTPGQVGQLGWLDAATSRELPKGWLEGWGATLIAVAPFKTADSLVIGRHGGPDFLPSEVARLRHLAALAG
jgi:hypothetical protein